MATIQHAARTNALLAILLVVVFAFSLNAWGIRNQQDAQGRVIAQQDVNTAKLVHVLATQCRDRNRAATGTNEVLSSLEAAVRVTKSLPAEEKITRLVRYRAAHIDLVACPVVAP